MNYFYYSNRLSDYLEKCDFSQLIKTEGISKTNQEENPLFILTAIYSDDKAARRIFSQF